MHSSLVSAPGPSIGDKVVDQLVCRGCQRKHDNHMQKEFWTGADHSRRSNCPKCSDGLTVQNGRPAYRRANKDGTWEISFLCEDCHADYRGSCRTAMEKKGEHNG